MRRIVGAVALVALAGMPPGLASSGREVAGTWISSEAAGVCHLAEGAAARDSGEVSVGRGARCPVAVLAGESTFTIVVRDADGAPASASYEVRGAPGDPAVSVGGFVDVMRGPAPVLADGSFCGPVDVALPPGAHSVVVSIGGATDACAFARAGTLEIVAT